MSHNSQSIILIRGLPGSGKSTLAKAICQENNRFFHCEADKWFVSLDGEYKFTPEEAPNAHKWCLKVATASIERGNSIIVSNTFVKLWEMQPYIDLANKYSIPFYVTECKREFQSIHNVPKDVIARMKANWEEYK